jgi:aerobic-type carbon monoxide dehydrogenase small subunit (CoxS/CutS family)
MKKHITLTINETEYELLVEPNETLSQVLRGPQVNLTGTKQGCELGDCGACTVLLNGDPVNSCLVLAAMADGGEVITIEGMAKDGEMHPIQESFINEGAIQCGYCSPGMIMKTRALLEKNPSPTRQEIREAMAGNLCRCTGYFKIVNAIEKAAENMGAQE